VPIELKVDRALLVLGEDVRLAEDARRVLGEAGCALEPWVALRLARTERDYLGAEIARLERARHQGRAATPGIIFHDSVERTRRTLGRRVQALQDIVAGLVEGEDRDWVVAMLLAQGVGAATAGTVGLARALLVRVREVSRRRGAVPSDLGPDLPEGVDAELLEDVRRTDRFRRLAQGARARVETWEVFLVALRDREATERALEGLRTGCSRDDLSFDVVRFFEAILETRRRDEVRMRGLRAYLATLPIGRYNDEVLDLAIAFILASSEGRARVSQWLEAPDPFRREAAIRVEGVIGRAQKYLHALRSVPAA